MATPRDAGMSLSHRGYVGDTCVSVKNNTMNDICPQVNYIIFYFIFSLNPYIITLNPNPNPNLPVSVYEEEKVFIFILPDA